MRFRRQRDDQVEIEPLPVLQLLEGHRPVLGDVDADLVHAPRPRTDRARPCARRPSRHRATCPSICFSSAAAIGERTELSPQANSTACGRMRRGMPLQPFQCSTQISVNSRRAVSKSSVTLRLSRSIRMSRALVVQAAPAHVDRLDAVGRRGADRRVVAVADQEIVLHDPPQRREREQVRHHRLAVGAAGCRTPGGCPVDAQMQRDRARRRAPTGAKEFSSSRS